MIVVAVESIVTHIGDNEVWDVLSVWSGVTNELLCRRDSEGSSLKVLTQITVQEEMTV